MRYAKDDRLKLLARRLGELSFSTPLLPESLAPEAWKSVVSRRQLGKFRGVREIISKGSCIVGFYAGGRFNTLITIREDWKKAIRLADMITHRVGPYRLRFFRANRPEDFNLSELQAQADWANEHEIAEVILGVEQYLRAENILAEPGKEPGTIEPKILKTETTRLDAIEAKIDRLLAAIESKVL